MTAKTTRAITFSTITLFSTVLMAETSTLSSMMNVATQSQNIQKIQEHQSSTQQAVEDKWSEWGLNREDWARYEELKKGARGIWSPNIDPLTALGVEANSEAERERYAALLAKKEYNRVQKEFLFQVTYMRVFEKLYPNQLPFRTDDLTTTPAATGRAIYFTRTDCAKCDSELVKLWSALGSTPVDIYIVDSIQDDTKIRDWAVKNSIDIEKVKSRQITLNHDKGYWLHYAQGKMPAAFIIQGDGQWKSLAY